MYLKRLELQGFKSFADKTVLEFMPGITTVIGPNGSGKSNISDSIRWVLGEQSMKSLRGSKSEDIIFAGTQNRKSLGFAEASIVIDNTDGKLPIEYSEVTVTRRIYRNGESGYYINKTPCRLKDVLELFMDTGIGKDGYSIIGQGKIDEILSNKSEDRRAIFEEAAGIVKYRVRKAESEKKLEQTKLNLLRINDILAEIEANIEPLKKQSEKAKKFLDLREELKQGNRSIFSRKLKELIEDRIRKKQQIMLFLNKRGYAGFISCRSCGYVMKCPHCDISLTAHNNGRLVCHYCGYQTGSVKLCPKCGSRYISGFKAGTQQVEEMLKKTFPGIRVLRMDMDTTSGKDGHEKIISEFAAHNADVLVGTQMIVKGHDFPDVTLVGVLAADMSLYTSDFRAGERTFQLLVQAAGRAGRKNLHGDVIIQTYTPDNYSIVAAQKQDYEMFYDDEISFRKLMGYPPVMHMLEVKISSKNEGNLEKSCDDMKKFSDMADDKKLFITGPVVPQVYKLNDIYTQVLYVKAADYERLTQFKDNIEVHVKDNILYKNVSVQFNFD